MYVKVHIGNFINLYLTASYRILCIYVLFCKYSEYLAQYMHKMIQYYQCAKKRQYIFHYILNSIVYLKTKASSLENKC